MQSDALPARPLCKLPTSCQEDRQDAVRGVEPLLCGATPHQGSLAQGLKVSGRAGQPGNICCSQLGQHTVLQTRQEALIVKGTRSEGSQCDLCSPVLLHGQQW